MRLTRSLLITGVVSLCLSEAPLVRAQEGATGVQQADVADVTSIELIGGLSEEQFTLLVRCEKQREANWFWVKGTTFVLDIQLAYNPFRGQALGELLLPPVSGVRASQFMAGRIPVARVEVDVVSEKDVDVRWTDEGIEATFGPPGPAIPAPALAGRVTSAAVPTGEVQAAVSDTTSVQPETPATETAAELQLEYRHGIRVNPFNPLLKPPDENVDFTNTLTRPLPDAEQMQLTGVSWLENRPDDSVALLRDGAGRNYQLKKGDRVKFGYVSQIGPREIVFILDIYGRHKVVTLKYNP